MYNLLKFDFIKEIMSWEIDLLPLSIPVLFLFIFFEWRKTNKKNKESYRFESTVLNISFGLIERIFEVYFFLTVFFVYKYINQNFSLIDISTSSFLSWIICLFVLDFVIYWYHRAGHTVSFLWAAHVIHHQCEEFNLTVAFRNGIFPHIFRSIFMIPLPLIGFPAEMILISLAISGIWQFFIHTTTIKKIGILEEFMMTPSLHRVHHASNEKYLDKNFGGMFIIWDRLMGTYCKEEETVRFGIVKPVNTFNLWKAYTHVWKDLLKASKSTNSIKQVLQIWLDKPGKVYEQFVHNNFALTERKSHLVLPKRIIYYLISQLLITTTGLIFLLAYKEIMPTWFFVSIALLVVFSSFSFSFLLEAKKWTFGFERMRLLVLCFILSSFLSSFFINWICGITIFFLLWLEVCDYKITKQSLGI